MTEAASPARASHRSRISQADTAGEVSFIQYINRIQFGFGACRELPTELATLGVKRPLVVSDRVLAGAGLVEMATEFHPESRRLPVFLDVPPNPDERSVIAGLGVYREASCDGLIAIGGGSVLDCAKAIALLASHGGSLSDFGGRQRAVKEIDSPIEPLIAIPTTAGTGSEVGRGAGVVLDSGQKGVFLSPRLIPAVAICDPGLTLSLPAELTAGSGIDAFAHAVEAFLSPRVNPPADAIALDAAERLFHYLPVAAQDATNRAGRWQVMMGAVESGMTTWKGLGAAHALAMPFEEGFGMHHGTLVGLVLPATLEFVLPAVEAGRVQKLAHTLGCEPDAIPVVVGELTTAIGIPSSLRDLALTETQLAEIGDAAADSPFNASSPKPASGAEYTALARACSGSVA